MKTDTDRLEAAGFFCRRYAYERDGEHLGEAVKALWAHMCTLDSGYLERWETATVAELVNAITFGCMRTFGDGE